MHPTRADDYLMAIAQICEAERLSRASTGEVARRLRVAKGTASSALKQLAAAGLVERLAYEGVALSDLGRQRAGRVARRRNLLSKLLRDALGLATEQAADEACRWEPVASDALIERIDERFSATSIPARGES